MKKTFAGVAKHKLAWAYLRLQARRRGIDVRSLGRIESYLGSKFGTINPDYADPYQRPGSYLPGLLAVPVHENSKFAWTKILEDAASDIKTEFKSLREAGKLRPHAQNLADAGNWNTYYFCSNGIRFNEHCEACPRTVEAIEKLPGAMVAGQAYFSVMSPGAHVKPHCGPTNTRIRCHLGLIVPNSSTIRVGQERLQWREGSCTLFDDSFEHEVWNADAERVVLIVDVWHPDLSETECWALELLASLSGRNRAYLQGIRSRK